MNPIIDHEPYEKSMCQVKFMAPNSELIPAKCKLKIARSTEPPE